METHQEKLRFAIIGCGRMGQLHSQRIVKDGRAVIVAAYDQSIQTATQLRSVFSDGIDVCQSWDVLLKREDIDAAIICTPTLFHFDQSMQCLDRGWHVLCEKPLADSRDRILKLIDAANSGSSKFSVAYQRRSWATYRRMRDELQSGRHGDLQSIHSFNAERWQQTIAGTWRDDPAINLGGFVNDAGSHKIDAAFYVSDRRPTNVFAASDQCGSHVEIRTSVIAQLEASIPLVMNFVGNSESFHEDLHVHCSDADLVLRNERLWIARDNQLEEISIPQNEIGLNAKTNPVTAFIDLLDGRAPNVAPPECALPVFDFTQAILESSATGKTVELIAD